MVAAMERKEVNSSKKQEKLFSKGSRRRETVDIVKGYFGLR